MAGPPYSDTAVILEQLGGGGESGDLSRSDGTKGINKKTISKNFQLINAGVGGKLDDSIDHFFNPNFAQLNAWYGNFAGDPNIPVPHNSNNHNNSSSNNNNNRNNSSSNNKSRQKSTTSQTTTPPQTTFSNIAGFEKQGRTRDFLRVLIS